MDEKRDSLIDRLRNGERITCPKCKSGIIIPFNTSHDKAHSFNCSNESCNFNCHWDPVIDLK